MVSIRPRWLCSALLVLLAVSPLSACAPSEAAPAVVVIHGTPLAGVVASTDLTGASDATGAAAIGATDSGPGSGRSSTAPEPTGGDGSGSR